MLRWLESSFSFSSRRRHTRLQGDWSSDSSDLEVADRGTLFLDEIGDLPLSLQAKLLRVLEDKEIRRVGGTKSRAVDVRILAAAHDTLAERVRGGTFREDLFFRLSTVVLKLPPLRERADDLMIVARALLARLAH